MTPSGAELLERAAALSGLSLSEVALAGARAVLAAETELRLAADAQETFLDLLRSPPHPTADLRRAVEDHLARVVPE